jgi:hypothetical protein
VRRTTVPRSRYLGIVAVAALLVGLTAPVPVHSKPSAVFPAGVWKGVGYIAGGISGQGVNAVHTAPGVFEFELEVSPQGDVIDGSWSLTGAASATVPNASAFATFSGGGGLGGTAGRVAVEGSFTLAGTVTAEGFSFDLSQLGAFPAAGGFSPASASCTQVDGDIATEARAAQEAAGFATSVTGPFVAVRMAKAGDNLAPGFDDVYIELVEAMDALSAQATPKVDAVVSLVEDIDAFVAQIAQAASCPGGPANLKKGKQPYTYFVEQLTKLLLKALDNHEAYSANDVNTMLAVAIHVGAMGKAAINANASGELTGAFGDALEAKIAKAKADGSTTDCAILAIAAAFGGYTDMYQDAIACA